MSMLQEINEMRARLDTLEKEAKEHEQEWPDGTPGWFWDDKSSGQKMFGFLGRATMLTNNTYGRYNRPTLLGEAYGYKHFEPLAEAILPAMIKHDGGEYPGDGDDILLVDYGPADEATGKCMLAREQNWGSYRLSYQVIKRADK